jgi:hypothetical protein
LKHNSLARLKQTLIGIELVEQDVVLGEKHVGTSRCTNSSFSGRPGSSHVQQVYRAILFIFCTLYAFQRTVVVDRARHSDTFFPKEV